LAQLLSDYRTLRLDVLNSCEGARTGLTDPYAGTAQTLVQQGVSAVIAMQFAITDQAAIDFPTRSTPPSPMAIRSKRPPLKPARP